MKIILLLLLVLIPSIAYGTHQSLEKSCSVSIDGRLYPVTHDGQSRNNPDGTLYPGDASHYLFKFRGSDTCQGFKADPIKSNGAIDILSHHTVMGPSQNHFEKTIHSHNDLEQVPKYLTTFHWYDIIGYSDPYRHNHNCKCAIHIHNDPIFSDNPVFSYREDKELTQSDAKKISYYSKNSNKYLKTETQAWGFTKIGEDHPHKIDHIFEDSDSIVSFETFVENSCSNLSKHQGCIFGHLEIDPKIIKEKCLFEELEKLSVIHDLDVDVCVDINDETSLKVQGQKIQCDEKKCKTVKVSKTSNLLSSITSPNFELILEKPALKDRDYYDGQNLDGTFYLHDPVTITHDPTLPHKESRDKTIKFETTKRYEIILEEDFDCHENNCSHTVLPDRLYPTFHDFINGQGMSVFNVTQQYGLGTYTFDYTTVVYNLDREIAVATASTVAEIVNYNPQWNCHPYPLLKDNFELAYDDRQAAACHYLGNQRDGVMYAGERSKINHSYSTSIGYDPHIPALLHQNFTFSEGYNSSDHISLESHNGTAMFVREGYGKLYFDYPLRPILFKDKVPQYENVTSFTTLYSNDFAAKNHTVLDNYSMRYPDNAFTKNIIIKNVNQNGTIIPADITLEAKPYENIGAEYIRTYIFDKILWDTSDEIFAEIISGDVYPMQQIYSDNLGILNVTISKTPIFFEEYTQQKDVGNKNFSGKLADLAELISSPDTLRLSLPYDIGLSSISPTSLIITVDEITNNFDERYFAYGGTLQIIVNTQKDNALDIKRSIGKIIINPPANFGQIQSVYVDGIAVKQECKFGCVLLFQPEKDLEISVENKWGGIAFVDSLQIIRPEHPISQGPDYRIIAGIITMVAMGYFVWSQFRVKK